MPKKSKFIHYEDGSRIALHAEDVPELHDAFFKEATPLSAMFPGLAAHAVKRKVGRPKSANPKKLQSFKLSADVIESIKATGAGFNTRVEAVLRKALEEGKL